MLVNLELPKLHPSQQTVLESTARHRFLVCGRRWGKTRLATILVIIAAVQGKHALWLAPVHSQSLIGWRLIKQLVKDIPGTRVIESQKRITFSGGGVIEAKSADRPDNLRGDGLDLVVFDESAFMDEEVWFKAIRPSFASNQGRAVFISTPDGRNWWYRLYLDALEDPDWEVWQLPTSDNPFIPAEEIEAARKDTPENIFRQEYLAEFIEDGGLVFRNVMGCIGPVWLDGPTEKTRDNLVGGLDIAKLNDYSVLTILNARNDHVVHVDRMNTIDYSIQAARFKTLYDLFELKALQVEVNSIGDPMFNELRRMGMNVVPFTTTNASKATIIENLVIAFERSQIRIPNFEPLVKELTSFESKKLDSGVIRYSAPGRSHDDCVMSLALAWNLAKQHRPAAWESIADLNLTVAQGGRGPWGDSRVVGNKWG